MKKVTLLGSLLVAGTLTFTGISGTAQADEEDGAKTVWGEVLPADADPDGDGWANTGFDPTWMSQDAQDRVSELADEKDAGTLSQVEFNEAVAEIFQQQMNMMDEKAEDNSQAMVPHQKIDAMDIDVTKAKLAQLALYSPASLDAAPVQDEPYNYHFIYGGYEFNFSYDGTYWNWSYDELKQGFTNEELMYLAHHNPEVLNQHPVKAGMYDFKLSDDNYVYHFYSNGEMWEWSYAEK